MNNISILFPDSVHFHSKNFKSLFDFITRHKISHTFIRDRNDWVAAYGNYNAFFDSLTDYFDELKSKKTAELLNFSINGVNFFDCCRDEALTYFLPNDEFRSKLSGVPSRKELIELMREVDNRTLLLNLSAAWSWYDFWKKKLKNTKNHTYACIFSGAQTYNRVLLELLKTHQTTPLVMEHFFTGNEYYVEEKYEPIPNNSNLKHNNFFRSIEVNETGNDLNRIKIKAINKVMLAKNKNVTQPEITEKLPFKSQEVITIIGQVLNDFSIICTAKKYLSSLDFYIELIDNLLNKTESYIVFKAHPWEKQKNNIKSSLTFDKITDYINSLPKEKSKRVFVTEDFNLHNLIKQSKHILTLCSQSAIEAAFMGVKPVQFGQAFYGRKGFTHDYDLIEDFIYDYCSGKTNQYLSMKEYNNFELFLIKYLEKSLVSVHKSGIAVLEKKLATPSYIPLVKPVLKAVSIKKEHQNPDSGLDASKTIEDIPAHKEIVQAILPIVVPHIPEKNRTSKKISKLTKDPHRFFKDSKHKPLNIIGKLFFRRVS